MKIIEHSNSDLTIDETWQIGEDEILLIRNCTLYFAPNTGIFCLGKIDAQDCIFKPLNGEDGWKGIADIGKGRSQFIKCHFEGGRGRSLGELKDYFIGRFFGEIDDYEVLESWTEYTLEEQEEAYNQTYGGALITLNSLVKECCFEDCRVEQDGGAVVATLNVDIEGCKFIRCHAGMDGGAVIMKEHGTLKKCLFESCEAGCDGGGGFFCHSSIYIKQCKFKRCVAKTGGGVFASEQLRVQSSSFIECHSTNSGGGISGYINASGLIFIRCTALRGGGADLDNGSSIEHSTFYRCSAKDAGGGLCSFVTQHSLVKYCRFIKCIAGEMGGGARIGATKIKYCEFKENSITAEKIDGLSCDHLYASGDSLIDKSTFEGSRFEEKKIPQFVIFESVMLESKYDEEHLDEEISICHSRVYGKLKDITQSVPMRIYPLSEIDFVDIASVKVYFESRLKEKCGKFHYRNRAILADSGTIVLFQYGQNIIAQAELLKVCKYDQPITNDGVDYHGHFFFDPDTVCYYHESLSTEDFYKIYPDKLLGRVAHILDDEEKNIFLLQKCKIYQTKLANNDTFDYDKASNYERGYDSNGKGFLTRFLKKLKDKFQA